MTISNASPTCFYHPIKVVFLDDNPAFLDALELEFSEKINLKTLTNSDAALHLFENTSPDITRSLFKLMSDVNLDTIHDRLIGFDISKLLDLIYDKNRFEHMPLLVVDYEMPTMNGIEFCEKLKDKKIFKVMLTAAADQDTAIKAFNNGLIDKFILKTSDNLHSEIALGLHDLTQRYFRELTEKIMTGYNHAIQALFKNALYQQLFSKVLAQTQAVEYYLFDNSGSTLFLDKDAKPTWLIVRHVEELALQLDLLQGYDLPEKMMTAVAKKEKILVLFSEKEYKKPLTAWLEYMFDAKKLDNNYYYTITQDQITDSIDWEKVISYSSYLKKRDGTT
jgi:CheY-like chemotaxis protein